MTASSTAAAASHHYHHHPTQSLHFASLAALGLSLSALWAFRSFPLAFGWAWQTLTETDWGNAVAALVAVGGYLLDHWNARQAQKLEVQIQKVNDQAGQLLVPITTQFHSLFWFSTLRFVDRHMDLVTAAAAAAAVKNDNVSQTDPSKLLEAFLQRPAMDLPNALDHPEAMAVLIQVLFPTFTGTTSPTPKVSNPTELPEPLHQAIVDCRKPYSKLWKSYESYVRYELVPAVQRIADIIEEHGHLMEPVPPQRLEQLYGRRGTGFGQTWGRAPRMFFYSLWLSYARSWQAILQEWDTQDYDHVRCHVPFPSGLMMFNIEAQTIVANIQKKLVGMSQMHGHEGNGKA